MDTVKARIRDDVQGAIIEAQRGKYKHWFRIGLHPETDSAFKSALASGKLIWDREILGPRKLF